MDQLNRTKTLIKIGLNSTKDQATLTANKSQSLNRWNKRVIQNKITLSIKIFIKVRPYQAKYASCCLVNKKSLHCNKRCSQLYTVLEIFVKQRITL